MGAERICRLLEAARWISVVIGFVLAFGYGTEPAEALHLLAPWLVGSLAGLTGIESVSWAKRRRDWRATRRAVPTSGNRA